MSSSLRPEHVLEAKKIIAQDENTERLLLGIRHLSQVIRGKEEIVRLSLVALLGRGHVLLEDVPGVGKTTLARALAKWLGGSFQRIQMTADLLPADIVGATIWDKASNALSFRKGPIFANVVLADELNRATPRTQSGLLEAMAEQIVTVDGVEHILPNPFFVIATQNPSDHEGVYRIPPSQLDRFMIRTRIGYPNSLVESELIQGQAREDSFSTLQSFGNVEDLLYVFSRVARIHMSMEVASYLQQIVQATREHKEIAVGISTRAALQWAQAARAWALLERRNFVTPLDIRSLAGSVCAHRLILKQGGFDSSEASEFIMHQIVEHVPMPK